MIGIDTYVFENYTDPLPLGRSFVHTTLKTHFDATN